VRGGECQGYLGTTPKSQDKSSVRRWDLVLTKPREGGERRRNNVHTYHDG